MPLSPPAPRRHLHTRRIELCGFAREDGAIDVEAHLTDTRTYPHPRQDGTERGAGVPLHDMWMRMTINAEREIIGCEAVMEATPFAMCPGVAANFRRLVGLRIEGGFLKQAMARVGGAEGCTHLRELLQQVGTVFVQTCYAVGKLTDAPVGAANAPPPLLNTCHAWSESGEIVARKFPAWYKPGPQAETPALPRAPVQSPPVQPPPVQPAPV
jgi:hypothetical protein